MHGYDNAVEKYAHMNKNNKIAPEIHLEFASPHFYVGHNVVWSTWPDGV